ncbi:phosphate ABC transporter substrate-binding protein, partial [Acinetobacter baumannii]
RTTALAWCSTFVLVAASVPANAANGAEATPARVTFDGQIRNNSLALSPDEATAVVSYSERPDVIVYDLATGAVRGVLRGYVTPRNIVFAP